MSNINRRNFIKILSALGIIPSLGALSRVPVIKAAIQDPRPERKTDLETGKDHRLADGLGTSVDPNHKFGMVIDAGSCIGCRRCQYGCKAENNTPDTISPSWIEIFRLDEEEGALATPTLEELKSGIVSRYDTSPEEGKWYLAVQCNHCENPPCVKVCPTGATYQAEDGLVLMDYDKCIGCRFCVVACPYSARRFNWVRPELPRSDINEAVPVRTVGVAEKCTLCVHRTREGKLPRCVLVCPVQARHFGDLADPESEVSKLLKDNLSFRLLEELGTEPKLHYITRGKKYRG